jgi:hypothetical protein
MDRVSDNVAAAARLGNFIGFLYITDGARNLAGRR